MSNVKLANYNEASPLKRGDKIRDSEGAVRTIYRVTEKRAYFSKGMGQFGFVKPSHPALSPEECDAIEAQFAKIRAEYEAEKERKEKDRRMVERAIDPHGFIVRKIQNRSDFLPWDKLTLEQLLQIETWLREAETK